MDGLRPHRLPFLEAQRPVVHAARQPKAVFGERRLAAEVAAIHAADLRYRDVALVGEDERIVGQIFEQGRRRLAGLPAGEIARIILDPGAGTGRFEHFEIEQRALLEPLGFEQAAGTMQFAETLFQFLLDRGDRLQQGRPRRHIMRIGIDLDEFEVLRLVAGERIEFGDRLDLLAEKADAPGAIFVVGREYLDRVAAHAKDAAREIAAAALVLQSDEVGDELALVEPFAARHGEGHRRIGLDRADAIDARHRGDDDHVVAFQQRPRRRMAHAVDLLVDRGFLLDIGVGARHIGFRLVIIVIGDEIFDRIVGKEALELAVELRGERLVRRQHEGRALGRGDHLCHRESLAGTGDAEQDLVALAGRDAGDEFGDRLRLVAFRLILGDAAETYAAFGFFRPRRAVRRPRFLAAQIGIAVLQQILQRFDGGGGAGEFVARVEAERAGEFAVESGHRPGVEMRLRAFAEPAAALVQRRIEQSGEMLVERREIRPRGLGMAGTLRGTSSEVWHMPAIPAARNVPQPR